MTLFVRTLTLVCALADLGVSARAWAEGASVQPLPPIRVRPPSRRNPDRALPAEVEEVAQERREAPTWPALLGNSVSTLRKSPSGDEDLGMLWVRGQDPIQNRFFVENVPLTDAQFQTLRLVSVPADQISRTEIYPSAVPLALLGDGLGGAVRFRLRTPETMNSRNSWVGLRGGSFGALRGVVGTEGAMPFPFHLLAEYRTARNDFPYFDDNGTPLNSSDDSSRLREFNANENFTVAPLAYFGSPGDRWRFWGVGGAQSQQVPGSLGNPMRSLYQNRHAIASLDRHVDHGWATTAWVASGRGSSETLVSDALAPGAIPNQTETRAGKIQTYLRTKNLGSWAFEGGIGFDLESYGHSRRGIQGIEIYSNQRTALAAAVAAEVELSPVLRFRAELLGLASAFRSEVGSPSNLGFFSPRVIVEMGRPGLELRASTGLYGRLPSLQEKYGSPAGLAANPDLDSEKSWKADTSGKAVLYSSADGWLRSLQVRGAVFTSEAQGLVAFVANSQGTRQARNLDAARLFGHEVGLNGEFQGGWRFSFSSGWLWSENLSEAPSQQGQSLPFRPKNHWVAELGWNRDRVSAGYTAEWIGAMHADLVGQQILNSQQEHSVWGRYRIASWGEIGVEIRNLWDQVATGASLGNWPVTQPLGLPGFPTPGRRWYVTWRTEW